MSFNLEDQYQQYLYPESLDIDKSINYNSSFNFDGNQKIIKPQNAIGRGSKMSNVQVLILNNPSKINKKLFNFFANNIDTFNQNGIIFEWIIVYEDEMEQYEEQEITEFPVIITDNDHIVGVDMIIDYLSGLVSDTELKTEPNYPSRHRSKNKGKKKLNNNKLSNDDSDIRNYFLKELDNKEEDDDEDDIFANTVTQRVAMMNKARQKNGQPTIKMSNPEIHERTARAASRKNNYKFDNDQNYDDTLQNAINNARKNINQQTNNRTSEPRTNNLELDHDEEEFRKNNIKQTPSPVDVAKSTSTGSIDDELMLRYWENNTESEY